jgi:hypothetical protein
MPENMARGMVATAGRNGRRVSARAVPVDRHPREAGKTSSSKPSARLVTSIFVVRIALRHW